MPTPRPSLQSASTGPRRNPLGLRNYRLFHKETAAHAVKDVIRSSHANPSPSFKENVFQFTSLNVINQAPHQAILSPTSQNARINCSPTHSCGPGNVNQIHGIPSALSPVHTSDPPDRDVNMLEPLKRDLPPRIVGTSAANAQYNHPVQSNPDERTGEGEIDLSLIHI